MNVSISIPDGKVDLLVAAYASRVGLDPNIYATSADKKSFLEKVYNTQVLELCEAIIQEQAQIQARQTIREDADLNIKKPLELELERVKPQQLPNIVRPEQEVAQPEK